MVRIGHPARLVDSVLRYSLDALISASDSAQIAQDVRKEIQTASVSINQAFTSHILTYDCYLTIFIKSFSNEDCKIALSKVK